MKSGAGNRAPIRKKLLFIGFFMLISACGGNQIHEHQRVLLVTEEGSLTIELYTEAAPASSAAVMRDSRSCAPCHRMRPCVATVRQ